MDTETVVKEAKPTEETAPKPQHPALGLVKSFWPPQVRDDRPRSYPLSLLAITGMLIILSLAGAIPWVVSFLATLALTATLVKGGMVITITAALGIALIIISALTGGSPEPTTAAPLPVTEAAAPIPPPDAESLGVRFEDISELWNSVDAQPKITKGLTVQSEPGRFDSFIYRFDDWGRLAGAYDPDTGSVYGLLATGQFTNRATDQLYLHLCFVVHPYSQECIENYTEIGLAGEELRFYGDSAHNASWEMDGLTWITEISGNVLTVRVLSEDVG